MLSMVSIIEALITGLILGALYSLASLGLSLVFGVLDVINFAHGDMIMLASYIVFLVVMATGQLWLSLLVSVITFTALGLLLYFGLIHRLIGKEPLIQIAITVGLGLVLQNIALALFRAEPKALPTSPFPFGIHIGPVSISANRLFVAVISVALIAIVQLYLSKTKYGLASLAVVENREAAWLVGINVPLIYALTFTIGVVLSAIAGFLWMLIGNVDPYLGVIFGLICWIIVALAGLGSVSGILVSGIIVGLLDGLGSLFLTPSGKYIPIYIAFILTVWLRPRGLFGRR